jgi:hypothetical protein
VKKYEETVICDIPEGGHGDVVASVTFAIGDKHYEIDLCHPHREQMRRSLVLFTEFARCASVLPAQQPRTVRTRRTSKEVREWAREQGIELNDRGRIPAMVLGRYEAAKRPVDAR